MTEDEIERREANTRERRAQTLICDLLGGGEEWGFRNMPGAIAGGVLTDNARTYIFARDCIDAPQRAAMAAMAQSGPVDGVALQVGTSPTETVVSYMALWRRNTLLELFGYRLWLRGAEPPAFAPSGSGPTVFMKCGRLIVSSARPWRDEDDRLAGLIEGDRLMRQMVWEMAA